MSNVAEKDIDLILTKINPYLEEQKLSLFSISILNEDNNKILKILVEDKNKILDLDSLVKISEEINQLIDQLSDLTLSNYSLEISTPGVERSIRNAEEFISLEEQYIYIELIESVMNQTTVTGFLKKVNKVSLDFTIEYNIKGQKKLLTTNYNNVKNARLAVKF